MTDMLTETEIWERAHEPDATEADLGALVRLIDDGHPPHCGCEECEVQDACHRHLS
jgi:hypothetical protein